MQSMGRFCAIRIRRLIGEHLENVRRAIPAEVFVSRFFYRKRTMMIQLTQPLWDEHQELLPRIKQIQTVADMVGILPIATLRQGIDEVYTFLMRQLMTLPRFGGVLRCGS